MKFNTLKETLFHEKMENGLEVYLLPKKGFEKTYGLFSTNFGSVDTTFIPLGQKEYIKVEDGIAHFLEHKMFDMKDGDASDQFALLGANTNAFTSSSRTCYLFSTTSHEKECSELLLDFVQELNITEESVEKEKGIIIQEIKMYDDDPDWRCYFGSIANLYQKHPVGIDIAGDEASVKRITVDKLKECYDTFYHPTNMMIFIVGNIDPESMMEVIRNNQNQKEFIPATHIQRAKNEEPLDVATPFKEDTMDVEMNKLITSIKVNDIFQDPQKKMKRELCFNLFFDLLFSKSSQLYNDWLEKGYINDTFSANFTQERDYAFIQMGGDQDNDQLLKETIDQFIDNIDDIHFNEEDFIRVKRKNIGNFINMYNSPESIANIFSRYYFEGTMSFDMIDLLDQICLKDVEDIKKYFKKEYASTYIVKKKS